MSDDEIRPTPQLTTCDEPTNAPPLVAYLRVSTDRQAREGVPR